MSAFKTRYTCIWHFQDKISLKALVKTLFCCLSFLLKYCVKYITKTWKLIKKDVRKMSITTHELQTCMNQRN